jgi:hypothetical protein
MIRITDFSKDLPFGDLFNWNYDSNTGGVVKDAIQVQSVPLILLGLTPFNLAVLNPSLLTDYRHCDGAGNLP